MNKNYKKGSILVLSIVMLLIMTTMGAGLYYTVSKTAFNTDIDASKNETIYTAESCISEAVTWLEQQATITGIAPCKNYSKNQICKSWNHQMNKYHASGESNIQYSKLSNKRCNVQIINLGTVAAGGSTGAGFDVGQSDSYAGNATRTKYLYRIRSSGTGRKGTNGVVEIVASTIF